jgi:hypothetical protein
MLRASFTARDPNQTSVDGGPALCVEAVGRPARDGEEDRLPQAATRHPGQQGAAVVSRLTYFRQLVVGKTGESVQTQRHEHGSRGSGDAPNG